jgi:hypothetical protein
MDTATTYAIVVFVPRVGAGGEGYGNAAAPQTST